VQKAGKSTVVHCAEPLPQKMYLNWNQSRHIRMIKGMYGLSY